MQHFFPPSVGLSNRVLDEGLDRRGTFAGYCLVLLHGYFTLFAFQRQGENPSFPTALPGECPQTIGVLLNR